MTVCGSCNVEMIVCEKCRGKTCIPGCIDRIDDGCTCEEDEDDGEVVVVEEDE